MPGRLRAETIARLYVETRASLERYASRHVANRAEAADVVQEAFTILLERPQRAPTRASAWCIVRNVALARRAEHFYDGEPSEEELQDARDATDEAAMAWLERVLGG